MPEQLQHHEAGDLRAETILVFLQGWPDNSQIWQTINWKEDLTSNHLLFIDLPNTNGKISHTWGKDFPELIEDLKYTIDKVGENKRKILIAHDWGCMYGYMMDSAYPQYFTQLITMDVPGIVEVQKGKPLLIVLTYQIFLLIAFLIGGFIGKSMTKKTCSYFKHNPPYFEKITSSQNYPYYYLWKNKILSALKLRKPYLYRYRPSVPTVYLYAKNKPFNFHGKRWISLFEGPSKLDNFQMHGLDGGHWFMKKYAKFITDLITRRIKLLK